MLQNDVQPFATGCATRKYRTGLSNHVSIEAISYVTLAGRQKDSRFDDPGASRKGRGCPNKEGQILACRFRNVAVSQVFSLIPSLLLLIGAEPYLHISKTDRKCDFFLQQLQQ